MNYLMKTNTNGVHRRKSRLAGRALVGFVLVDRNGADMNIFGLYSVVGEHKLY